MPSREASSGFMHRSRQRRHSITLSVRERRRQCETKYRSKILLLFSLC
jgi:hypothetical protein